MWPPAALSTAVHLLLIDCTRFASSCCEMLPHSSTKAPASSRTFLGRMALALTLRSNRSQTCIFLLVKLYGFFMNYLWQTGSWKRDVAEFIYNITLAALQSNRFQIQIIAINWTGWGGGRGGGKGDLVTISGWIRPAGMAGTVAGGLCPWGKADRCCLALSLWVRRMVENLAWAAATLMMSPASPLRPTQHYSMLCYTTLGYTTLGYTSLRYWWIMISFYDTTLH